MAIKQIKYYDENYILHSNKTLKLNIIIQECGTYAFKVSASKVIGSFFQHLFQKIPPLKTRAIYYLMLHNERPLDPEKTLEEENIQNYDTLRIIYTQTEIASYSDYENMNTDYIEINRLKSMFEYIEDGVINEVLKVHNTDDAVMILTNEVNLETYRARIYKQVNKTRY